MLDRLPPPRAPLDKSRARGARSRSPARASARPAPWENSPRRSGPRSACRPSRATSWPRTALPSRCRVPRASTRAVRVPRRVPPERYYIDSRVAWRVACKPVLIAARGPGSDATPERREKNLLVILAGCPAGRGDPVYHALEACSTLDIEVKGFKAYSLFFLSLSFSFCLAFLAFCFSRSLACVQINK